MGRTKLLILGLILVFAFSFTLPTFAQPTASQTIGGITQQDETIRKDKTIERVIKEKKQTGTEAAVEDINAEDAGPKMLVSSITVEGATLISEMKIKEITGQYEGKELSLKQMQKVADLITDEYRAKGYATSRAYIPPQTIKDGMMVIKVIEGRLGNLQIQGNRYFKTSLLKRSFDLDQTGYFDYSALQKSLVYINESPDRKAKAVLMPGAEPGTTDVVINVEDNLPIHFGQETDNWGSRYIGHWRYAEVLEHNNLLGFDDKLYVKWQNSNEMRLQLMQGRYIFPVDPTLNIGANAVYNRTHLGKEYEALAAGGEANIYGLFLNKTVLSKQALDIRYNLGFDYKKIRNMLSTGQQSRDEVRVLKTGFDFDYVDTYGRNVLTTEADFGFPDFLNGMASKDPNCSRTGAGGTFQKMYFNYFRLQPLPLETSLLWKNSAQYSNHNLVASEQFQIGGATSVRGYPPGEFSGDKGYYTALEWSVPAWGLPKDIKVPFRKESLYDAFRMVFFWDLGFVNLKTLAAGDKENRTLKSWGLGSRLNLSNNLALRVETAFPTGQEPSDANYSQTWVSLNLKF